MARTLNQVFNRLQLVQAPDKTFIGRRTRGWGVSFRQSVCGWPPRPWKDTQRGGVGLCEQQKRKTAPEGAAVLDAYVLRWQRWCKAGLEGLLGVDAHAAATLSQTQSCAGQA